MIVVCPNTIVSKLVYDWIAGRDVERADRQVIARSSEPAMLTEGWDANTVTHILGIRRFGSQLLCEQVVGRGLRHRSYAVNDNKLFDPEYAEVYSVPFAFIPGRPTKEAPPRPPAIEVYAVS